MTFSSFKQRTSAQTNVPYPPNTAAYEWKYSCLPPNQPCEFSGAGQSLNESFSSADIVLVNLPVAGGIVPVYMTTLVGSLVPYYFVFSQTNLFNFGTSMTLTYFGAPQ
jgi:hypothetical protein